MKSIDYNDKRFKELKVVSLYVQNLNNKENKHKIIDYSVLLSYSKNISKKLMKQIYKTDIIFNVNMDNIIEEEFNNIIKNIVELWKICLKSNIDVTFKCKIENESKFELDKKYYTKLLEVIKICNIKDLYVQYQYIYDKVCEYLDKLFEINNYCDFKEDKCICQRKAKTLHDKMGCCYTFEYSRFSHMPIDKGLCKYLKDKRCTEKCITCKMFTCGYLRKKGVKFKPEEIYLLRTFFNKKQIQYLKNAFFKKEIEIINRLIELKSA